VHEVSLAIEIVRTIVDAATANGALRVESAEIELGDLTCVDPETLRFAFEVARKDTVAANCVLHIHPVALVVRCAACGFEGAQSREELFCPDCEQSSLSILKGRELRVLSIEVEDLQDA